MESREYIYKTVDGAAIGADVYYDKSASEALPIVLYFHGGNFTLRSKEMMNRAYIRKLVDLGFIVVSANYRLCPTISLFDGPVTDAFDAYQWAQTDLQGLLKRDAHLDVDRNRIVTFGHSCGGTLALLTASLPDPPLAVVDVYGMKYLDDPAYHTPSPAAANIPPIDRTLASSIMNQLPPPTQGPLPLTPTGPDLTDPRVAWMFLALSEGTHIKQIMQDDNYERVDPARMFSKFQFPPTYFIHGANDTSVSPEFSRKAYEELRARGNECKLEIVEGAGHGFDNMVEEGNEYYDIICRSLEFLREHV